MRRSALVLPVLLSLAACAARVPPPAATAAFQAPAAIELRATASAPLLSARLIAPDGAVLLPEGQSGEQINPGERPQRPQFGVFGSGGSGQSFDPGFSISLPALSWFRGARPPLYGAVAQFRLPAPADYRRTWQFWQIRLDFADGGELLVPAPDPAP